MERAVECRKSFRMPFIADVLFRTNGQDFRGVIQNLSSTGFFMKTDEQLPEAIECEIEIVMSGKHSRLKIDRLRGQVIRSEESGVGVEFAEHLEWIALIPIYCSKVLETTRN